MALLAAAGCAGDTPVRSVDAAPNGVLSTTLAELHFRTSFCSANGEHFAAVGSGTDGSEPFVVTITSPNRVSVRFGVREELEQAPYDAARWRASPSLRLRAEGDRIVGTGELLFTRDLVEGSSHATISLQCGPSRSRRLEPAPYLIGEAPGG